LPASPALSSPRHERVFLWQRCPDELGGQEVTLEVERLSSGSERSFKNATLERMHGGRCDTIGNDSEFGLAVDLRDRIDQLEVLRCIHDAPVTMMRVRRAARAPSNRRAEEKRWLMEVRLGSHLATFVIVEINSFLRSV